MIVLLSLRTRLGWRGCLTGKQNESPIRERTWSDCCCKTSATWATTWMVFGFRVSKSLETRKSAPCTIMFRICIAGCCWLPCGTPTSVLTKRWHWPWVIFLWSRRIHTASCLPSQRSSNRACSSSVTRIVSILSRFIGIITPMNRNPPYTEASVTKQEKTALNMARFIRSQTLTLLEKLNELDADEQADICESLHDHADELYRSCLARFGDDGENLWHMQLPETVTACLKADAGSRQARQGASAGVGGCRGAAMTQSRSDSGVYTGLTMRHQSRLYWECTIAVWNTAQMRKEKIPHQGLFRFLVHWIAALGRSAAASGISSLKGGNTVIPRIRGKRRKKHVNQRPSKGQEPKKGPVAGVLPKATPPEKLQKTVPNLKVRKPIRHINTPGFPCGIPFGFSSADLGSLLKSFLFSYV
nr:putative ketoreductase [synthetic construct]